MPENGTAVDARGGGSTLARTHRLVWTALMGACIAVGAWLQLPIGPVPITFQPFFVLLSGLLLGPLAGVGAVLLYVAAGALGLPVFAGGAAGIGVLFGPTGGYLLGSVIGVGVAGLARRPGRPPAWLAGLAFGVAALAIIYGLGVVQLRAVLGLSWRAALAAGVAPFVLQDLAKLALAVAVARFLAARRLSPA